MTRQTIMDAIIAHLESEQPNSPVKLGTATNLLEEWFVDSMAVVKTVLFMEKNFAIRMERADISARNFESIDRLSEYVLARREKQEE